MYNVPANNINIQNIRLYFEAVARDQIDSRQIARKTHDLLRLRDRLYVLPQIEFDAAIKTMEMLCHSPDATREAPNASRNNLSMENALQLYDQVKELSVGGDKISGPAKVS